MTKEMEKALEKLEAPEKDYCPCCRSEIAAGAQEFPMHQLLVAPMLTLKKQIAQLEEKSSNGEAEPAVLEQIRLHCDSLSRLFATAINR